MSDHAWRRLTLAVLLVACVGQAWAAGVTYVVSAARGKDTNAGTNTAPWRTINKAANAATAGSTVLIEGGTYTERVSVQVSGSAAAGPITFTPKPGQSVILRSPAMYFFSPDGFPVGLIDIRGRAWLTISGLEIENYFGVNSNTFPAGIAIVGSGDHITISHNHVHNIEGSRNGLFDAHGIAVYGFSPVGVTNVIIDGNEVDHLKLGQSESVVLNGNVSGWQVTNNRIHDNDNIGIDAIGFEGTAANPNLDQARNGLIEANQVYDIDSNINPTYGPGSNAADGIYVDGGAHIVIERNLVHHTDIGIEMASEHKGRTASYVIARNNLVYFNYGPAISLGGYDTQRGWSSHVTVVNNTLFANDSRHLGAGEIQFQFWPTTAPIDNQVANNMVCPNAQAIVLSTSFTRLPPVKLDHDLYCNRYSPLSWTWAGAERLGLAAFRAASGQEGHGLNTDPLFVSQTAPNLQTLAGSPARGAGVDLGAAVVGVLDFAGIRADDGRVDRHRRLSGEVRG